MKPQPGTTHQHCRLTLAGDKGVSGVHIDPCFYSGILYLSLPEHCRGGTDFFRHRRTGLDRAPTDLIGAMKAGYPDPNALIEDVVNGDTLKARPLGEELHRADALQPADPVQPLAVPQ